MMGLAVHSEADKLYFTNYDQEKVEVVGTDGSERTTLITGFVSGDVHGITLDVTQR